ncbi:putative 2-deoxyglucose-6-phosphate phosphatase [Capsicum annuum]|uniref:protein CONSERVED ONLY IN THE GREEN LINEAGE 160, chloroplastic isoform X2 n=1 Tax=Capsicum annuum TaxID=4072 RepID=UPI0007BF2853|nr:protein CONSERVED ONLY IN THE GREEN LINEAGE 160, chloroplastic isoform X2 [Capsicum annuum]XP_016580923.1 protein CONSERVED ONLY IN THE GREEN LINEAGE 160, chloroplastic isoform X2 [Capsicum annuum]KAF3674415.1 putative 2-deoxyglucose-6-phosphate phosphatase [Capsicum annuum]
MSVLNYCYLSVTSTATPISQDSSNNSTPLSIPTQSKQKPVKLSSGDPPITTTTKLRKYWGEDVDPLTSDEFIWNTEFMGRMKKYVQDPQENAPSVKEETSGFLSLNRVMSLNSLEVDLTKELTAPSEPALEPEVENTQARFSASPKWRPAPTRREQEKWGKAAKAATGGSDVMLRELKRPQGDPQVMAAQSREQYLKLKNKLLFLTVGIGGVGVISAYISYSPEIAASYGAGLIGSLMYMRMLGNSVDSMRSDGPRALIKGAVGQPRLLVPVALVMIFNRWNGILVPEYGFMHLELIPMLVGFFTYKIATFVQAIEEGVSIIGNKTQA